MTSRIAYTMSLLGFVAVACTYQLPREDANLKCGDGLEDPDEECDDGNLDDEDGCDSNCTKTRCGNGIVTYEEVCDDGNLINEDACTSKCKPAACGDGFVQDGVEKCDDGNGNDGDGCDATCIFSACGNGIKAPNEACDDGNTTNGDKCNPTCTLTNESSLFVGGYLQPGYENGIGKDARMSDRPLMVAHASTLYITGSNIVRSVDIATGTVTTIAGKPGIAGHDDNSSDGLQATFGDIDGIATDGMTLWVADTDNHLLRAVDLINPAHPVKTVAGTFADVNATVTAKDGFGADALFGVIRGMVYYAGFVYILDNGAHTLRMLNPMNGEVKTIAGFPYTPGSDDGIGEAARFRGPRLITSDNVGMLYISDTENHKLRSFNTTTKEVKTIAGGSACGYQNGVGTGAFLNTPRGLATDGFSVYFTEPVAQTIRQLVLATGEVSTLSGTATDCATDCTCMTSIGGYQEGIGAAARWSGPWDIAYDKFSGHLFVSDGNNAIIRRIK